MNVLPSALVREDHPPSEGSAASSARALGALCAFFPAVRLYPGGFRIVTFPLKAPPRPPML